MDNTKNKTDDPRLHQLGYTQEEDRSASYREDIDAMFPGIDRRASATMTMDIVMARKAAVKATQELLDIIEKMDRDAGNAIIVLRSFAEHAGYSNGVQGYVSELYAHAGGVTAMMRMS